MRIYLLDSRGLDTSLTSFAQYDEIGAKIRHSERSALARSEESKAHDI